MKHVLIIGSGIAGMSCALRCADRGLRVTLVSPYPSERAQSVMAAGGINAVTPEHEPGDSVDSHAADTLKGGSFLAGEKAVRGLCAHAEDIVRYLESIGTVFSVDGAGRPLRRAFGGQSFRRTYFCGTSTGKQIVSALIMEIRRFEAAGLITRRLGCTFHSALIEDSACFGALLSDSRAGALEAVYADAVVVASGGQNALFGKTTGSSLCDGYAAGRLFLQGAELKNLEFIQYHPTTLETPQKRMLITEAARGEGGRLFYEEDGRRVYFLEDRYGPNGNLMTRDVIAREIDAAGRPVFLDISFLGRETVARKLPEVRETCLRYGGFDPCDRPIPVQPSVHFFMGGLAVHLNHETNIRNLFAVGECASIYHGANRLGGNSLLAALYSGRVAGAEIADRAPEGHTPDFGAALRDEQRKLDRLLSFPSPFPVMYIRDMLAETMRTRLGIVRDGKSLEKGLSDVDHTLSVAERIRYDASVPPALNYSLTAILTLARAVLVCAKERRESRGAHYRSDYPETAGEFACPTLIAYDGGAYRVRPDREGAYES